MRASTLFGLTIAILIGMAVVFGVKSAGFFDRKQTPAPPPDRPRILVAAKNLYEGIHASPADVTVRAVEDHEMDQYIKNKHKYMPVVPAAVDLREIARNIPANEPLLKEHFKDLGLPDPYSMVLEPMHRAVNLQLPKDRAGAGLIRKNDTVDVYLTTTVCADQSCRHPMTLTAPIALGLKVVFKRDSLFNQMKPNPEGLFSLVLQARPYRAALIEFAKNKGMITVVPTGPDNKKKAFVFVNEGKEEERRDIEQLQGKPISDIDLEEIFRLQPIPRQPERPAPEQNIVEVHIMEGVREKGTRVFTNPDKGGPSWVDKAKGNFSTNQRPPAGEPGANGANGGANSGASTTPASAPNRPQQGASAGGFSGDQYVQYGDRPIVGIAGHSGQPMVSHYGFRHPGSAGSQDGAAFQSANNYSAANYASSAGPAKKGCAKCNQKAAAASY